MERARCRAARENATPETGFLSGSAGAAYMFLERYARDRDPADLATARGLLRWVNDQAVGDGSGGLSWPISRGSAAMPAGFELGAAGIAWVNLRAYHATGEREYRDVARRAAVWLRSVAIAGSAWAELPGDATVPVHVGLDSGAAGIGWVLEDLARAGLDPAANRAAARSALAGLRADAAPRPPRGVLVRQPDRKPASAACRTLVALGLSRDRRLRRPARRMVRQRSGRAAPLTQTVARATRSGASSATRFAHA